MITGAIKDAADLIDRTQITDDDGDRRLTFSTGWDIVGTRMGCQHSVCGSADLAGDGEEVGDQAKQARLLFDQSGRTEEVQTLLRIVPLVADRATWFQCMGVI